MALKRWSWGTGLMLCLAVGVVSASSIAKAGQEQDATNAHGRLRQMDDKALDARVAVDRPLKTTSDFNYVKPPTMNAASFASAPGPGMTMGVTWYDYQHNGSGHHQIAVDTTTGYVHAAWMHGFTGVESLGVFDRTVSYNMWNPSTASFVADTVEGQHLSELEARSGYTTMDLTSDGLALVAYHGWNTAFLWSTSVSSQTLPGLPFFSLSEVPYPAGPSPIWPVIEASASDEPGVTDVVHVVSTEGYGSPRSYVYYRGQRLPGGGISWSLPVYPCQGTSISAVITENPTDNDVALVWARPREEGSTSQTDNDVAYLLSTSDGADWAAGLNLDPQGTVNVTNYTVSEPCEDTYRAYADIAAIFDFSGELHIVWNARYVNCGSYGGNRCDLLHWAPSTGIVPITVSDWDAGWPGSWQLNLAKMSIGVGAPGGFSICDGESIENLLYVYYTQFGGHTQEERDDVCSVWGTNNGELYLLISSDGGATWGDKANTTNTKTPNCNPYPPDFDTCGGENFATIARIVSDTAHILYIADIVPPSEGPTEGPPGLNPVKYLRLAGPENLCPTCNARGSAALSDDPTCVFHAAPGTQRVDTLTLTGTGAADWIYQLSTSTDTLDWLSIDARPIGAVHTGDPPKALAVTMDATSLSEGWHSGSISIDHNDPTQGPITIPVSLFVHPTFACDCQCLNQGDVAPIATTGDGKIDVLDVIALIDYIFRSGPALPQDPFCPAGRGEFVCDGVFDVLDVVAAIDYVFRSGVAPCDPCACVPYPTECP